MGKNKQVQQVEIVKQRSRSHPLLLIILIGIAFYMGIAYKERDKANTQPQIITTSKIKHIIDLSDLSTYQATYNGIATVYNKEKPEKVDYYITYNSKVDVGIDFDKVNVSVDNENKTIMITLPEMEIMDIIVDIGSMDYIFVNKKANKSGVSEKAYDKCIEDATLESKEEEEIINLAKENAQNIMRALVEPFVEQLDEEYTIDIR